MIDIEKFICSLLADHPEGVTVRNDIHRALKDQGLEYKDGKIVPIENKESKEIPNSAWSEEDENVITAIIAALSLFAKEKGAEDCFDMETTWLKSLKDRYTWKPSKEQMDAMQVFLEHGCAAPDREATLAEKGFESLYNDLKNL